MANGEHLKILKQGVKAWNDWREQNPTVEPDLVGADLSGADLRGAQLSLADLSAARLRGVRLRGAHLGLADLSWADLRGADLSWADLSVANLSGADVRGADLNYAVLVATSLGNVELSVVKGLETVRHSGPSSIGIDTIYKSQGNIPEVFLRGAGVPDSFITYMKPLIGSISAIEYYSCFISYSSKDEDFAKRLYADLQGQHVRCWFSLEDLKIGDKFRSRIDDSIRVYDKLMVVLSENSIQSPWVEEEVEAALEKERRQNKCVLFPIRLDAAVMETTQAWAASLRRTRHIGDFRTWKDHDSYQNAFARLLRDLRAHDKPGSRANP